MMNKRRRGITDGLYSLAMQAGAFKTPAHVRDGNGRRADGPDILLVRNAAADTAELLIYGDIGMSWWGDGVTANDVAEVLKDVTAPNLDVFINSNGGDVFHGVAIHTMLVRHPARVTVYIDGIAASAASFIAQAGDLIKAARNAMVMVHDASTYAGGNAAELRETADLLDKVSQNIADMYAERAGDTADEWRERMHATTWYTGVEAVAAGLADEIATGLATEDKAAKLVSDALKSPGIKARFANVPAPPAVTDTPVEPDEVEPDEVEPDEVEPAPEATPLDDETYRYAMSMAHWMNTGSSGAEEGKA